MASEGEGPLGQARPLLPWSSHPSIWVMISTLVVLSHSWRRCYDAPLSQRAGDTPAWSLSFQAKDS